MNLPDTMLKHRKLFKLSLLFASLFSATAAQAAATGTEFRISGIMQLGANKFQALVEFNDGEKKIVAAGDTLAAGKIVSISDNCLVLSSAGKTLQQCLTGADEPPAAAKSTALEQQEKARLEALREDISPFKNVDKVELQQTLDRSAKVKSMAQFSANILPLANITTDQQITQIEALNVTSVQDAINSMRDSLEQNRPIRLTLSAPENQPPPIIYLQTQTPK